MKRILKIIALVFIILTVVSFSSTTNLFQSEEADDVKAIRRINKRSAEKSTTAETSSTTTKATTEGKDSTVAKGALLDAIKEAAFGKKKTKNSSESTTTLSSTAKESSIVGKLKNAVDKTETTKKKVKSTTKDEEKSTTKASTKNKKLRIPFLKRSTAKAENDTEKNNDPEKGLLSSALATFLKPPAFMQPVVDLVKKIAGKLKP